MAARATFALKAGKWFRRGRLLMVSLFTAIIAVVRHHGEIDKSTRHRDVADVHGPPEICTGR